MLCYTNIHRSKCFIYTHSLNIVNMWYICTLFLYEGIQKVTQLDDGNIALHDWHKRSIRVHLSAFLQRQFHCCSGMRCIVAWVENGAWIRNLLQGGSKRNSIFFIAGATINALLLTNTESVPESREKQEPLKVRKSYYSYPRQRDTTHALLVSFTSVPHMCVMNIFITTHLLF